MSRPGQRILTAPNFRWLFAETLVIVLGVLIALALNDAWTERQERQLEISYLERLEREFGSDLAYIRETYLPGLERKKLALESIAPYVRGQLPVPEEPLEFLSNVSLGGVLGGSERLDFLSDATFRDLQSTGNLRLIRDTEIRAAITNYYLAIDNELTRLEGRNSGYVKFIHGVIPAELRDDMNMAAIENMGLEFALERLTSDEFRTITNAEYNKMLLMSNIPFESNILKMIERISDYRQSLQN